MRNIGQLKFLLFGVSLSFLMGCSAGVKEWEDVYKYQAEVDRPMTLDNTNGDNGGEDLFSSEVKTEEQKKEEKKTKKKSDKPDNKKEDKKEKKKDKKEKKEDKKEEKKEEKKAEKKEEKKKEEKAEKKEEEKEEKTTKKTQESLYHKEYTQKVLSLIREPVTPLRIPPTIMRVLILPYVDEQGNLNVQRYVFFKIDEGRWVLGEYLLQKGKPLKELKEFKPLEEEK